MRLLVSRRWLAAIAIAVLAAVAAAVPSTRESALRAIGATLVNEQPLSRADVIVLSFESGGAGTLEAADLVREGVSKRVAVFADPPSGEDFEFIRRGLPYEDMAARRIDQLAMLGVKGVERIPMDSAGDDAGTHAEAHALPRWCETNGVDSVVLIVASDHSRRVQRVMERSMRGQPTRLVIRASRYSRFDPNSWWRTREGLRIGIVELQKLALDVVTHPLQ